MTSWKKIVGAAVALAIAGGAGAAVAQVAGDANGGGAPTPSTRSTKLLGNGITEDTFVPITPCRILDTREATAGKLVVGSTRIIDVRGSEATFTQQGGNPGGCGVPAGATAIEATVTAVDAGSGFLRAWPANLVQPNATFLNYDDAFNVSNTGTMTLCGGSNSLMCIANQDLNLRAYGSNTDLVIDVGGYFIRRMSAKVSSTGSLVASNRASSASKLTTGEYEVIFDRNVSSCTFQATLVNAGIDGFAVADNRTGVPNGVFIQTRNGDNSVADRAFYVEAIC